MKYIHEIIAVAISVLICICETSALAQQKKESVSESIAMSKGTDGRIIDAVQKYDDGDIVGAERILDLILKNCPGDDAAWYYKGLCGMKKKDAAEAELSLKKAVELDSSNYWYRYMLANLYGMTGRTILTIDIYESLLKDFPKRSELYYSLANLYISQNQLDKALGTLHDIEMQFGKSDATVMTRFNILRQQNKNEEAYKTLEEYNKEYSSPQVLALLGDYQMGMYNDSTALSYYDQALAIDRDYAPALLGKAETYRLTRKYPQYFNIVDILMADRAVPSAAKADYLQAIIRQIDPRFIKSFQPQFDTTINIVNEIHPTDTSIMQVVGLYYYITDRKDKSVKIFRDVMDQNPDNVGAAAGYIQMLVYMQDWKRVVEASDSAFTRFPKEPGFLEYSNAGQYNLKNWPGIIANCEKMLKSAPGDSAVAISAWSTMGDIYHMMNEPEKSYKAYDNVLKANPNYAPVLNNYAYYLSMQGKKLKKAYQMSKRTVEAEPDNATYLDTFGWILYLQGKYLEAKPFFKHAMMYGGKDSATILDHYAAVLEALGEKDLAKVYRQQARNKNAEGKE